MVGEGNQSFTCTRCKRTFTRSILVRNLGFEKSYYACPYCFNKIAENKCPNHYLGYLSERSKGEGIPEECMICEKTIECMLFKLNKSDRAIKEIRKWYK